MKNPTQAQLSKTRKRQAVISIIGFLVGTLLTFSARDSGASLWLIAGIWVIIGAFIILLLRQIEEAITCPNCALYLDGVIASLERQGSSVCFCPKCGESLGLSHHSSGAAQKRTAP